MKNLNTTTTEYKKLIKLCDFNHDYRPEVIINNLDKYANEVLDYILRTERDILNSDVIEISPKEIRDSKRLINAINKKFADRRSINKLRSKELSKAKKSLRKAELDKLYKEREELKEFTNYLIEEQRAAYEEFCANYEDSTINVEEFVTTKNYGNKETIKSNLDKSVALKDLLMDLFTVKDKE